MAVPNQNPVPLPNEVHSRPAEEKPLDFPVNLDDLEAMDLTFDDHMMHPPQNHSKLPFPNM